MPFAFKVVAGIVAVLLVLSVGVGLVVSHYIGGFFRTVEREAKEDEAHRNGAAKAARNTDSGASGD